MVEDIIIQKKRLARNTLILYIRTIVTLIISLYTSRVVLQVLGIDDYGIYNIIGGFVSLFAVVSQTMVASTQRYLTFELGKIENNHSREVYSTALIIHVGIALFLLVLFESIGLWFLNAKLNIAPERMQAANWLFQFSVFTFILNIIRSPYEALIIAHEKMSTFAFVNIMEASLKLSILFFILLSNIDRLIQYGFYLFIIALLAFSTYAIYCACKFNEVKFIFVKDKTYYKGMLSFAGYNFVGASSAIIADHGVNIVLNVFFGVAVNAARGIAVQVSAAISKFVSDFTTALNPQITKSYATGDIDYTMSLVYKGSKFSFLLYLIFSLPIFIQTPYILELWLGKVPDFAVIFVRWTLIIALLNTFANPLTICAFATGQIKKLSLWLGSVRLLVVPIVYIAFKIGNSPIYAYIVCFCTDCILLMIRLNIVCDLVGISKKTFILQVLLRTAIVLALALGLSVIIDIMLNVFNQNFLRLIFEVISVMLVTVLLSVTIGLNKHERGFVYNVCKNKIRQFI